MTDYTRAQFDAKLLKPRYWGVWFGYGLLALLTLLPFKVQMFLGKWLGRLSMKILKKRLHITRRNIQLCFPDLSPEEQEQRVIRNFEETGRGIFDTGIAWFWPEWRMRRHMRLEGEEHLKAALDSGKGIILLSAHFLTLEVQARMYGIQKPGIGVYRPHNNPLMEFFQVWGRTRSNEALVDRKDVRGIIKALRHGHTIWYAPDHDYGPHRSVFAPLFGVPAATVTGTATLAKVKNTLVLPSYAMRDDKGYTLVLEAPPENYPTGDDLADATITNGLVERAIMRQPEHYMWLHRRFKTRPEGEPSLY